MTEEQRARAREVLLEHLPIGSDWTALRAAILDGSIAFHSDPLSWAIEGAIAALQSFADEARLAEQERCAQAARDEIKRNGERVRKFEGDDDMAAHACTISRRILDAILEAPPIATAIRKVQS